MDAHRKDDSVVRELRGFELARRLIFHEVRTETISKLTGLSHNRLDDLATTSEESRMMNAIAGPRPARSMYSCAPSRGRTEGAAVAALFPLFKNPASTPSPTLPR